MVTQNRPTRAPALGEQLAAVLRDQIVRRTIAPGTHLVVFTTDTAKRALTVTCAAGESKTLVARLGS